MREIVVVVSTRRKVFSSLSLFPLTLIRAKKTEKDHHPNSDKNPEKSSFDLETKEKKSRRKCHTLTILKMQLQEEA